MDFNNKKNNNKITPKSIDITKWYTELIHYAKLAKYGPIKGTIFICPIAYNIWEEIQVQANKIFKAFGIENVYFPLLIPMSLINKEKSHIQGFQPELAIISKVGNKDLSDPITIRPTSETLFSVYFKEEIQSYKDLPIILNQWCNVVRWEKNTRPFLRNSEFLWQEGHGCFATIEETQKFTYEIIQKMQEFFAQALGIHTIIGKKTNIEKFAGAIDTYTLETIMPNGYGLQIMTSHYFGTNFSKNFEINFLDKDNMKKHVFQNSFGFSTRLLASLIMMHGDDYGLVLPPLLSKYQINILGIFKKNENHADINKQIQTIANLFNDKYVVNIDNQDKPIGYKCIQSELQGIPVYIEVGTKDIASKTFNVYCRHLNLKQVINFADLKKYVCDYLDGMTVNLLKNSINSITSKVKKVFTKKDLLDVINAGNVALAPFSLDDKLEKKLKEDYAISSRCISLDLKINNEKCVLDPTKLALEWVYFAKSY